MPSPNDRPTHPIWDVFGYLLANQIRQACNMSKPTIDIDDDDLADMLHHLIGNLALGLGQKEIYRTVAPCLKNRQQRVVFSELCRWIFATEGVLPTLYRPLLSQPAKEVHGRVQVPEVRATGSTYSMEHDRTFTQNSALLRLPNELLDNVLSNLNCLDNNDLRLTCRQARMRTFSFWSRAYFRTRQFMVDEYSLQTLVDISVHPQLSMALTHLIIGVDEIETKETLAYIRGCRTKTPSKLPSPFQYWRDAALAQQALLNTGRAINLLSTAMSNLPNLDSVSVSGSKLFRRAPYYSKVFRYPHSGFWSYGSSAYQMQPRYTVDGRTNSKGFVDRVFNVVLTALARSTPGITTLRTNLNGNDVLEHLGDEAFNILPAPHIQAGAASVLGSLTELHLDISLESQLLEQPDTLADHDHVFDTSNFGLRKILTLTYNLQSLSLNFFGGETIEGHCDFTAWLSAPATCSGVLEETGDNDENSDSESRSPTLWNPPPIALTSLSKLVLKGLFISPSQLRAIFTKFNNLKSAALDGVYLRRCFLDHPPVPEDTVGVENLWASFFRSSSAALAKLDSLELDNLAIMQYREDPDDGVAMACKDIELVLFAPEDGGEEIPSSFKTVTNFGKDSLKRLARETRLGREVVVSGAKQVDD